jgi:hypothetical protein
MNTQRLYNLLPAIYRLRDRAEGEPLRALLAAMESELQLLEGDIDRLYENWFIETCASWVVPYIGDLLDVEELYAENSRTYGQQQRRAYVANTIAYRRRKGTAPMLEQLTRDVTGWRSRAVEFFESLATTQNINHLRDNSIVSLRESGKPELLGTPFEKKVAYSIDIRTQQGKYNISNIGLFIWRLQSYPINKCSARMVKDTSGRYYTFSVLGDDTPLFNQPQTETNIVHLAEEINVPGMLRRLPLKKKLDEQHQLRLMGKIPSGIGYFDRSPVLQVFINNQSQPIPPSEILIAQLKDPENDNWIIPVFDDNIPTKVVAVDPESGRLAFLNEDVPNSVEVSYSYGFSGDIGAGCYQRQVEKGNLINYQLPITHSQLLNPLATTIQNWNKSVEAWECLNAKSCVSLAEIVVGDAKIVQVESEVSQLKFAPGIVRGLNVSISGNTEVTVKDGVAIDNQGRAIALTCGSEKIDLATYSQSFTNRAGLLILSYKADQNHDWQINLIEETAIDGYPPGFFIPLARLLFDGEGKINGCIDSREIRSNFQPGIVTGLKVIIPKAMAAVITAGIAVDAQGRVIRFDENISVDLKRYQGKSELLLLLSYTGRIGGQITLISKSDNQYLPEIYLQLACLDIPEVKIEEINSTDVLQVSKSIQGRVIIKSGSLSDGNEKQICLFDDCQLDLSDYLNSKLILFISNQKRLGLPLSAISGQDWQKLGVVTSKPSIEAINQIKINDNATYTGDLTIIIPAETKLKIMAASGFRTHIRGNLFIKGVTGKDALPGKLILEGLLIEGKVTVLPGNLKNLQINYCTLVPNQGGLTVEAEETITQEVNVTESESEESLTLIAAVMYYVNFLQILFGKNTGKVSSEQALNQLLQLAWKQANLVFNQIWQLFNQSPQIDNCLPDDDLLLESAILNNSELKISINCSICGAINLNNTVPSLNIKDSIIDGTGKTAIAEGASAAIAAVQTTVDIDTTTVFGRIEARILEASNSIFTAKVTVLLQQVGCLRFCYVPINSITPRRYLCQPDRVLALEIDELPPRVICLAVNSAAEDYGFINRRDAEGAESEDIESESNCVGNKLFLGTEKGVFCGDYDGNWQAINRGLTNLNVTVLAVDGNNNQIFAGTANGGIFRFTDNDDWQQINPDSINNTDVTALLIDSDRTIFAGTAGGGVFRRKNNGNWEEVNSGLTNRNITALVSNGNKQIFAGTLGGGVFKSKDNGDNWTQINLNLGKQQITALTVDANGQLYALTLDNGVFRLDGDSNIWQPYNSGLTTVGITHLVADETEKLIAATVGGEIFFSINGGDWELKENIGLTDIDITALAIDTNSGNIFIGTETGNILRSDEQSVSWKSINNGLRDVDQKLVILSRSQPRFTSTEYGNPGYAQLSLACATEIRTGAEDNSEMGVFSYLKQPQRQANLQASLDEYLRFGLQAGIFYIS